MRDKELFNLAPEAEFFGRRVLLDYICSRAGDAQRHAPSILLTGGRWTGKTEVLKRVHRRLFWGDQVHVAPVYYRFKGTGSVEGFAEDYLKEVVRQSLAFKRQDAALVRVELPFDKLERLLVDGDESELAGLLRRHREAKRSGDRLAILRNALAAPDLVAAGSGICVYLVLDDMAAARRVGSGPDGDVLVKELFERLAASPHSFLASSSSTKVLDGALFNGAVEVMELAGLDTEEAVSMMMEMCRQYAVEFDTETLNYAAIRLAGNPMYMKNIVWAAHRSGRSLVSLKDFVDLYATEITAGATSFALSSSFVFRGLSDLRVAHYCMSSPGATSEEELEEMFVCERGALGPSIANLEASGLVETGLGTVKWAADDVIGDFISQIYEVRVKNKSTEEVKTCIIRDGLKQGYRVKGSQVQGRFRSELVDLLGSFNGQKVNKALLRNRHFASGNGTDATAGGMPGDQGSITLPQVVGTFDAAGIEGNEAGPGIIVANGFQHYRYDAGNEVIWLVGVKDANTPVNAGDVSGFIRRTALLRTSFRSTRVVRWLVGREGFTGEALNRADPEGIFTADAAQLKVLAEVLRHTDEASGKAESGAVMPGKEFEVVLPMSSKAELVAARAVEEVGTEMGFDEQAIGKIKTALVEACINAFEHSGSRAGNVHIRFVTYSDRLVIHVQNRGAGFSGTTTVKPAEGPGGMPRKRGWGIELMKGLMDEVRFENIKNGAKIVMVKYLLNKGELNVDNRTE